MKIFSVIATLVSFSLIAQDNKSTNTPDIGVTNARGTYGANLANGSPNLKGDGFYLSTDLLYWGLYQDFSLANSLTTEILNNDSNQIIPDSSYNNSTVNPKYKWGFGFKTGFGYYSAFDDWKTGLNFTWFKTQNSANLKCSDNDNLRISVGVENNRFHRYPYSDITSTSQVTYYDLQWLLGRDFFVSKYLSIQPNIGIKSTWFYENSSLDLTILENDSTKANWNGLVENTTGTDRFVGVGPMIGALTKFNFCKNWSLSGLGNLAILYGKSQITSLSALYSSPNRGSNPGNPEQFYVSAPDNFNHYVAFVESGLFINYDSNFSNDKFNVSGSLGYDVNFYFESPQYPIICNQIGGFNFNLTFSF